MSQADFIINSQNALSARTELSNSLQALASNNSGSGEPVTKYANMWWYETDTNTLKIRNEANSGWISVLYFDQSNNLCQILDNTKVVTTTGSQVGVLGDQATSTWEAGTGTTESLVSPEKVKAAILAATVKDTWVTFNGEGTISIRNSYNGSSLTDRGNGQYTVQFSNALPITNYATVASRSQDFQSTTINSFYAASSGPYTTLISYIELGTGTSSGLIRKDAAYVSLVAKY